ncbi:MAG: glycine cleavage system aminomethyltransferase GcvT [Fibrobacterota bacterium]
MNKTPLFEKHKSLGARIVDFGGWRMPVQYSGVIAEYNATRERAALYDICHMGEFLISGKRATAALSHICTNDINKLKPGVCHYTFMCTPSGGTVDDLIIFRLSDEKYMLVVNAANTKKDFDWIKENAGPDVDLEDISQKTGKIDLQGPQSAAVLERVTNAPFGELGFFRFLRTKIGDREIIISRSGYTGELGYELFAPADFITELWNIISGAGTDYGLVPAGLGARDILRLEMGYSLYGHELTDKISPVCAGINFAVKFNKDEFIGKEALLQEKENGPELLKKAFIFEGRGVPREGSRIFVGDRDVGFITSGSFSPSLKKPVCLGYVKTESVEEIPEAEYMVEVRNRKFPASETELPFYRKGSLKQEVKI